MLMDAVNHRMSVSRSRTGEGQITPAASRARRENRGCKGEAEISQVCLRVVQPRVLCRCVMAEVMAKHEKSRQDGKKAMSI